MKRVYLLLVLMLVSSVCGYPSGPPAAKFFKLVCEQLTPSPEAHGPATSGHGGYLLSIEPAMTIEGDGFVYKPSQTYKSEWVSSYWKLNILESQSCVTSFWVTEDWVVLTPPNLDTRRSFNSVGCGLTYKLPHSYTYDWITKFCNRKSLLEDLFLLHHSSVGGGGGGGGVVGRPILLYSPPPRNLLRCKATCLAIPFLQSSW